MTSNQSKDSQKSSGSEKGGSGNFANDPQRASEEGRKGGQQSQGTLHKSSDHKGSDQKQNGNTQLGGSNHAGDDRGKLNEKGGKGAQQSPGGSSKE